MTRLLVPTRIGLASGGQADDQGFLSRLAKFIPAESGSLFTVVNASLAEELGGGKTGEPAAPFFGLSYSWWALLVLVIAFLANILLLYRMYDVQFAGNPLKNNLRTKHIFASSCGFLIWAYAIKSPVFASSYKSFLAYLLIGVFLIIVQRVKPPVEGAPQG